MPMPMETGRRPAYRRFSFHAAISACNARPAASAFAASSAVEIGTPNTPITSSRVAISELDTGRQANSLAHRREREAAIGVTHGMAKPGIAFDAIMHVVATLYCQGDFVAEGPKDIVGPRGRAPPLLAGTFDDDD